MARKYELVWLDGTDATAARAVAVLHRALLPHSPVAMLGEQFLASYYYSVLPRLGLIEVVAARLDGDITGFLSITADADGFMRQALWRTPIRLSLCLASALVADWRRVRALREAAAISGARRSASGGGGEFLSFAVAEHARRSDFIRTTGVRLAGDLITAAMDRLRMRGVATVRCLVDADNRPVRMLYSAMGWQQVSSEVPGWRTPQVEFELRLDESPPG